MMEEPSSNYGKIRNILTLEERVSVIKAYEKKPVYQKVANMFKCSSKQIKNIIANRESILHYYASRMADGSTNEARRSRYEKIVFLGKVMYEFVLRAQYHNKETPLTVQMVRNKALEAKETIKIPSFYPNNAWINNFKLEYNIADFNVPILPRSSAHDLPPSLDINDIIVYVRSRGQRESFGDDANPYDTAEVNTEEDSGGDDISGPSVSYGDETDEYIIGQPSSFDRDSSRRSDRRSLGPNNMSSNPPKIQKVESIASTTKNSELSEYTIKNYIEALSHLKPLEDFVLLEEDYRAIGLISQLEKVLKYNPTRNQI